MVDGGFRVTWLRDRRRVAIWYMRAFRRRFESAAAVSARRVDSGNRVTTWGSWATAVSAMAMSKASLEELGWHLECRK
jgi:hypothetical protein